MPSPSSNEEPKAMPGVNYGFIGIGRMGFPMALNLRAKMPPESKLVILHVNKAHIEDFVQQSQSLGPVEVASSPKEVAEKCSVIITSLPPGKPVQQVFTDPSTGIVAAGIRDKSKLIIDTSTMDVQSSLKVAQQVVDSGFGDFVDCPVSGGMAFATRGELSSMIGGSKELFDQVRPIVLSFSHSNHVYHCGPLGSGLAAKIIIKACELAVKKGYVYAEGIVWLSAVGFGGLAIICACFIKSPDPTRKTGARAVKLQNEQSSETDPESLVQKTALHVMHSGFESAEMVGLGLAGHGPRAETVNTRSGRIPALETTPSLPHYSIDVPVSIMASSFRRLAKDHSALQHSLPPNYLFPEADDTGSLPDDLTQLLVLITGAEGTPYSQGLWRLHLKMPHDYPKNPPKATFKTRIYHPNVEESTGAVCLETLKRDWDPKLTLKDILVTISCLLIQPNPDSALNSAAGALIQEDYEAFATQAKLMTSIHAPIPTHLRTAVEKAKRRGEDEREDQQTGSSSRICEPQTTREESGEDNTKENEPAPSHATSLKTSTRGKRPLCEVPTPVGSGPYGAKSDVTFDASSTPETIETAEPPRKSPKVARSDTANTVEVRMDPTVGEDKENIASTDDKVRKLAALPQATVTSKPSALRNVSNIGAGRPRVGIRRL